jgi:hypothetical protein
MTRLFSSIHAFAATAFLLAAGGAAAANLLGNPNFTTDVAGWTADAGAAVVFSATDANGSAGSGSARVTNSSATPSNGLGISRCGGAVAALANYTYGGKVLFPTGQANTGDLQVGIRWLAGANCTGATVGSQPRLTTATPSNIWVSLASAPVQAPAGAVSVLFLAFPSKVEAGGTLIGQFDDLYIDDGAGVAPSFLNGPPPGGTVGTPYNFVYAAGGSGSPAFSVTAGALPNGLSLSAGGTISGTPTQAGTFSGTVTLANGTLPNATQNFSITIAAAALAEPTAIPTLGESALAVLALLIGLLAMRRRRDSHS